MTQNLSLIGVEGISIELLKHTFMQANISYCNFCRNQFSNYKLRLTNRRCRFRDEATRSGKLILHFLRENHLVSSHVRCYLTSGKVVQIHWTWRVNSSEWFPVKNSSIIFINRNVFEYFSGFPEFLYKKDIYSDFWTTWM